MTTARTFLPDTQVAFIGGGNMAQALVTGLLAKGFSPAHLHVADPDTQKRATFTEQGVTVYDATDANNTAQAIAQADVVILAVKPQVMSAVLEPLQGIWQNQLVISIAAGVTTASLAGWLSKEVKLVRAMPNTPAMIQMGATGLYATAGVSEAQKQLAEQMMAAVGLVIWVENEDQLHAVTAVSGSAPAYFFYLLEHMIATGEKLGLSGTQATALVMQTALGSAQMALTSVEPPAQLRKNVTSPNGTTQAALEVMDNQKMYATIEAALQACVSRSQELSQQV